MQLRNGSTNQDINAPKKTGVKRRIGAENIVNPPNQMELGPQMIQSYHQLSYPGQYNAIHYPYIPQIATFAFHSSLPVQLADLDQFKKKFLDDHQQQRGFYQHQQQNHQSFPQQYPLQQYQSGQNIPISAAEENNAIESLSLELENGEGKVENTKFTEAQLKRKVQCRTMEGTIFEVPWCLMMQSLIYADMWINLGQEDEITSKEKNAVAKDEDSPFVFNLPTITAKCFRRIVDWMRHRHGQPEFELKFGQETGQQIWFDPDEWERNFGFGSGKNKIDLEAIKDLYLAANFLDLRSLFHYCVQEFAFFVTHANNLKQVRDNLCLIDDLTSKEKAAIYLEFDIPYLKEKISEFKIVGKLKNPLPPELVHPIFAKLSLSDQRWFLPLNRDAYKYLADRVRKNWSKWMDTLNAFIVDVSPTWYFGHPGVHIPPLQPGQRSVQWTASHFLAHQSLQTEMLSTQNFIEHQNNSINAEPIADEIDKLWKENNKKKLINSILWRAIEHMEKLFQAEKDFQQHLAKISKRFEGITSMNCYKRGLYHLIEQRRQILDELEANEMKELEKKLADLEKGISEYWVHRL